jgi:hypothetical protein
MSCSVEVVMAVPPVSKLEGALAEALADQFGEVLMTKVMMNSVSAARNSTR